MNSCTALPKNRRLDRLYTAWAYGECGLHEILETATRLDWKQYSLTDKMRTKAPSLRCTDRPDIPLTRLDGRVWVNSFGRIEAFQCTRSRITVWVVET